MKHYLLALILGVITTATTAQTLERMQWFNEPENWEIKEKSVTMDVTPLICFIFEFMICSDFLNCFYIEY